MSHTQWRKSSYSGESINCVEVAFGVGVRDSKEPQAGRLVLDLVAYQGLLGFAKHYSVRVVSAR